MTPPGGRPPTEDLRPGDPGGPGDRVVRRRWAVRLAVLAAVAVVAAGVGAWVTSGRDGDGVGGDPDGTVEVVEAWAAPSTTALAVYLGLDNGGPDDRLVGASTDVAGSASLMGGAGVGHTSADGATALDLDVPPGTTELLPGESHLMFTELTGPLEAGDRFPLRLTFERAGDVTVEVEVLTWDDVVARSG